MRPEFEQALALMKDGGDQSLNQAVSLLQSAVYSFSMHMCGHPEDAEDTMQDVLVRSIHYLPRIHHPKALAVWLYKVARTRCGMSRRKSKYAPEHELPLFAPLPVRDAPGDSPGAREARERMLFVGGALRLSQHPIGDRPPHPI
jgi:RNA polymerase sigma-70 factor (ECF subfamily)